MAKPADFIRTNRNAVIIVSLALSLVIITLVISQLAGMRANISFTRTLQRADVLMDERRYEEAGTLYRSILQYANSPRDFLVLASRGRQLLKLNGEEDYALYSDAVSAGFRGYPGNEDLRALQVGAYLEEAQFVRAADVADGLGASRYDALKVEAILRAGRSLEDSSISRILPGMTLPLSPQAMADPEAMLQAGLLTGDIRYFVNGAVMLAALGRIDEAYNILYERRDELAGSPDAVLLLRLARDAGKYSDADEISRNIPPALQLQPGTISQKADLYFYSGDSAGAYELQRQALKQEGMLPADDQATGVNGEVAQPISDSGAAGASFNTVASMNYRNIAALEDAYGVKGRGDLGDILKTALERIPSDTGIILSDLRYTAATRPEDLNADFAVYKSRYPDSFEIAFQEMLYHHRYRTLSSERPDIVDVSLDLLNRVNTEPDDESSLELLFYFFALQDDRDGLASILNRYSDRSATVFVFYRGYLAMLRGDSTVARGQFLTASDRGYYPADFNLGLMDLGDRRLQDARRQFLRAEDELMVHSGGSAPIPGTLYNRNLTSIRVYIALTAALQNDRDFARQYVDKIEKSGGSHYLLPRVKEMIAQSDRH